MENDEYEIADGTSLVLDFHIINWFGAAFFFALLFGSVVIALGMHKYCKGYKYNEPFELKMTYIFGLLEVVFRGGSISFIVVSFISFPLYDFPKSDAVNLFMLLAPFHIFLVFYGAYKYGKHELKKE